MRCAVATSGHGPPPSSTRSRLGAYQGGCSWFTKGEITLSTIRRHGVAFHLIPTPGDDLWLEVIRESDGAVLVNELFRGEGEAAFAPAVEEWFDDIVRGQVDLIDIALCRACNCQRRDLPRDDSGHLLAESVVEWEFDLCRPCASNLEQSVRWMRGFLAERYIPEPDEPDE